MTTYPKEYHTYYCLINVITCFWTVNVQVVFVCDELPSMVLDVKRYMQITGIIISIIFLLVTLFLHIFIPQLRADIQAWCLMSHMKSLLVTDIALFVSFAFTSYLSAAHCVINGKII